MSPHNPRIDLGDALQYPWKWNRVTRTEALTAFRQGALVTVTFGSQKAACRFDESSPVYLRTGPFDYNSLRYFVYLGGSLSSRPSGNAPGNWTLVQTGQVGKAPPAAEADPEENAFSPEMADSKSVPVPPPRKEPPPKIPPPLLGGVHVTFTDGLGQPLDGLHAHLQRDGMEVWEGDLPQGLLQADTLAFGVFEVHLTREDQTHILSLPWQGNPLVSEIIPLRLIPSGIRP